MKIEKKELGIKKLLASLLAIILLLGIGAATYYQLATPSNNDDGQQKQAAREEAERVDPKERAVRSEEHVEYNESNPARDRTDTTQPPTSEDAPLQQASATINIPNYQAADGTILVNVAISEPWDSSAHCVMELRGPRTQTVKASVFPQAQISGCQLEATNLPPGSYSAAIFAESNSQRTHSETININL